MKDIIEMHNNIPVVDSRILAKGFNTEHRSIRRLIETHIEAFNRFGFHGFEIQRTEKGRNERFCYLDEKQATFLISLMRNSVVVVDFKERLVNEFYRIKDFITKQSISRVAGKVARRNMTHMIEESGEQERMHNRGFSNYTLLAYDLVGLKSKYKLWKQENKDSFRDTLTADELERLETVEDMIKNLLKIGKLYSEIKESLKPLFTGLIDGKD